jgi:hypothetical protein
MLTLTPDDRAAVEELGQKLRRGALKVGFLMKCGDHNKTWHRRWFILGMDCLGYFESDLASAPLGACWLVPLRSLIVLCLPRASHPTQTPLVRPSPRAPCRSHTHPPPPAVSVTPSRTLFMLAASRPLTTQGHWHSLLPILFPLSPPLHAHWHPVHVSSPPPHRLFQSLRFPRRHALSTGAQACSDSETRRRFSA